MDKKEAAQYEWEQALKDHSEESDALYKKLKKSGRLSGGLDGNREDFHPLNQKLIRRMKEIQEKYKD